MPELKPTTDDVTMLKYMVTDVYYNHKIILRNL
jgi:hypothetical protein